MARLLCWLLGLTLVLVTPAIPLAASGTPPTDTQDAGATPADTLITVSLILQVQHPAALEQLVQATEDPSSPQFHRFLSLRQFVQQFAPSFADIASVRQSLAPFGLQVTEVYADHLVLKATGTADEFNQAFGADLHDYTRQGRRFHRPGRALRLPAALRSHLLAVSGLSNEARVFHPMHVDAHAATGLPRPLVSLPTTGTATGQPGNYTVGDVANMYDINPLYGAHIAGAGRTIGIFFTCRTTRGMTTRRRSWSRSIRRSWSWRRRGFRRLPRLATAAPTMRTMRSTIRSTTWCRSTRPPPIRRLPRRAEPPRR
jgi:subtilase family serine protease